MKRILLALLITLTVFRGLVGDVMAMQMASQAATGAATGAATIGTTIGAAAHVMSDAHRADAAQIASVPQRER
jgi:hypothetical protein